MQDLSLRKNLVKYFPKHGTGSVNVVGALKSLEKYFNSETGISFNTTEILVLVKTIKSDTHHIWGYLLDTKDKWMRVEVNINGDLMLLYVNKVVGYSVTLFQEDTSFPTMLSLNLRSYTVDDRLSYSTIKHIEFRDGEPNYVKRKELFKILYERKFDEFHKLLPPSG